MPSSLGTSTHRQFDSFGAEYSMDAFACSKMVVETSRGVAGVAGTRHHAHVKDSRLNHWKVKDLVEKWGLQ
jgi:hypothetical protein